MNFERVTMNVRVVVGIAGLVLCCGGALGQSSESSVKVKGEKTVQPAETVGGLAVPADGEVVVSKRAKALGYITDPLWVGRVSPFAMTKILEQEVRKMKHSPPTPEELKLSESTGEAIERMFVDHRERMRKFNNETRGQVVALRKTGGFGNEGLDQDVNDESFTPLLYINPDLIEPSGVGRAAIKVPELTREQHTARETLRALILSGPVTEDIMIQVMATLEEDQRVALEDAIEAVLAQRLKAQKAQIRTAQTGRMDFEDLSPGMQERANAMEPRQRAAFIERMRMNKIAGGAVKLAAHRKKVREHTMKGIQERQDRYQQEKLEREQKDNPDDGE